MKPKLRFAALRRVSTEAQERMGESLRTQTADLETAVRDLGGTIIAWYGGQESATPGHEKKEVKRLLEDAQKGRFEAVVVAHPDRWSRDNTASREGLEVFKAHGIRFFAGGTEYDLFNPEHEFYLGISAVVGQFHARNQALKSIRNRINRAKRGIPTGGKLPFGRVWIESEKGQGGRWQIDPEKHRMIQDCAARYLGGESVENLAVEYGVNASSLHKVLTVRSGPKWALNFRSDVFKLNEQVEIDVPPLLDEKTIAAILAKVARNKTYRHGEVKHRYLFSGMLRCAHCGYVVIGQTNHNGKRYYRHAHARRVNHCPGPNRKAWVVADQLEDMVMRHLFEVFGNPAAVQKAIEDATPNDQKIRRSLGRKESAGKELDKAKAALQRIIKAVANGIISDEDAAAEVATVKQRIGRLEAEVAKLDDELQGIPSADSVRHASRRIADQFKRYPSARLWAKRSHANRAFDAMTYAEKRSLCEAVFSGKTPEGHRMGVSVTWKADRLWTYCIEGHFIQVEGRVLTDAQKDAVFVFGAATHQKDLVAKSALY